MTFKRSALLAALCAAALLVGCGGDTSSSEPETHSSKPAANGRGTGAREHQDGAEGEKKPQPPKDRKSEPDPPPPKRVAGDGADRATDPPADQPSDEEQRSSERHRKEAREKSEAEKEPPPHPKPGEATVPRDEHPKKKSDP